MGKMLIPVSFGMGIMIGVTVGAAAALLYAPHSGKITRNKLKNKYEEKLELLNEKIIDAQQTADSLKNKITS